MQIPGILQLGQEELVTARHPGYLVEQNEDTVACRLARQEPEQLAPIFALELGQIALLSQESRKLGALLGGANSVARRETCEFEAAREPAPELPGQATFANAAPPGNHDEARGILGLQLVESLQLVFSADEF